MTDPGTLSVALPWSLSHYIPLQGFHPLYQALIEDRPENIEINAWDNAALSQCLRKEKAARIDLLDILRATRAQSADLAASPVGRKYIENFWYPNLALTRLLPGQIELHHTTPYHGMTRPFILLAASLEMVLSPFSGEGGEPGIQDEAIRRHYASMFESDLCLGIFFHVKETSDQFSRFFQSQKIDRKLFHCEVGLARSTLPNKSAILQSVQRKYRSLTAPCFFLDATTNRREKALPQVGIFTALRFWQQYRASGNSGKLYIHGARPDDGLMRSHQVDTDFLHREEGTTIIWIAQPLDRHEHDSLLQHAHFFLSPDGDTTSLSIMRSMILGAIPVTPEKENEPDVIVRQLMSRVTTLMAEPEQSLRLAQAAVADALVKFDGQACSRRFWEQVRSLYAERKESVMPDSIDVGGVVPHQRLRMQEADWKRWFDSAPGPNTLIYTGYGNVTEIGGVPMYAQGAPHQDTHRWSVIAEYLREGSPELFHAVDVKGLAGRFMLQSGEYRSPRTRRLIDRVSQLLAPYPPLHSFAARTLGILRTLKHSGQRPPMKIPEPHIALIRENISGMNIVTYNDRYYAVPCGEGAFSITRFETQGYSAGFVADSLRQVQSRIAEFRATDKGKQPGRSDAQLMMEGVRGFNILHCAARYYAIPQGEGAFDYQRILNGDYSRLFSGETVEAVQAAIQEEEA